MNNKNLSIKETLNLAFKNHKENNFAVAVSGNKVIGYSIITSSIESNCGTLIDLNTNEGNSIGRTFRDSPDIDNTVIIDKKLDVGSFYNMDIVEASNYRLKGKIL